MKQLSVPLFAIRFKPINAQFWKRPKGVKEKQTFAFADMGWISEWRTAKSEKRCSLFLASNVPQPVSNQYVLRRLLKQSVAVVVGSLLYFFVLMPHLPPAARHQPFRGIDLGFLVDAWVCLVLYGIVEWLDRKWQRKGPPAASRKR